MRDSYAQKSSGFFSKLIPPTLFSLTLMLAIFPRVIVAGNFYSGTTPATVPWPGGVVPYQFTNALNSAQQKTYLDGLMEWSLAAKVSFIPHTTETHWVLFTYDTNGFDNVSGTSNPQIVSVDNLSRAQVCHEMGHSFGFTHENIRRDQTNYLTVLTNNIFDETNNIMFFTIDASSVTNGNYDFESVMHLGWDFESKQAGVLATQQPKPPYSPRYQFRMGSLCLSPGDRAALAFLYGQPTVALTNVVTNTADSGPGCLRAAIYYATDHPGTSVRFNIPNTDPGFSNGVYNIHLSGHLPPFATNGMIIDGSTQPGFSGKPLIVVDGSQILFDPRNPITGLLIYSANNQIKNVSFSGFVWNGLTLLYPDAISNTISGCWLGVDATGTNAAPNAFQGILIASGASSNTIGGTSATTRNVLSGNTQYGIIITDSNTTGNVVLGNYSGTDASGSNVLRNGKSAVIIGNGSHGNIIGSTNAAGHNILSGNTEYGVFLTNTFGNVILGNYIGTDVSGTKAIPNGFGGVIAANYSTSNTIGGATVSARNVISGNTNAGIWIGGAPAFGNVVQGNIVGLNAAGTAALPNTFIGMYLLGGSQSNQVLNNVFSGHPAEGLRLEDFGTSFNVVQGNFFGTDITGSNAIGNGFAGVTIFNGATSNTIGGSTLPARNVSSGNEYGSVVGDAGTSGNVVAGNLFGLNASGKTALPNTFSGMAVWNGATNNIIGGVTAGAANYISGNFSFGLYIRDPGTSGNLFEGNFIGTDITGTNAVGNGVAGVDLLSSASGNFIGGITAGAGNVIAFSGSGPGVVVTDPATTNNSIRGNSIFTNGGLGIDLNNDGVTANDTGDADTGPNNLQNFPIITNTFGYATTTVVTGTLNSTASKLFAIDFYASPSADPSGYGEGKTYIGTVNATTGGTGNTSFAFTNTTANFSGQWISATATSPGGDTSEFSLAVLATNKPAPSAQFTGALTWTSNSFALHLTLATNFNYRVQFATNLAVNPVHWADLTNFSATNTSFNFTDHTISGYRVRFYRVISP